MRPLPAGLRLCDACGEVRGTTPKGLVSACYCSGTECLWCGKVVRRPISDYYDRRDRTWWHASSYAAMAHSCGAPVDRRVGPQWQARIPDPDVARYQDATTALAWSMVEDRARARERTSSYPVDDQVVDLGDATIDLGRSAGGGSRGRSRRANF